jgi:hypothetical protein
MSSMNQAILVAVLVMPAACSPKSPPTAERPTRAEAHGYALDTAHEWAFGGFATREEIVQQVTAELAEAWAENEAQREAARLTDEALAEHARAQATWKGTTDCERLDQAFVALEAQAILARQNFEDCGSCGDAAIHFDIDEETTAGRKIVGYTYYHSQSLEGAVAGQGLYLGFGSASGADSETKKIGATIVHEVEKAGLRTTWNGDTGTRILVAMEWRRRR